MADPAQDARPDPLAYLEEVIDLVRDGARRPAGLHLDPELCRGLADGLGDVRAGVELLVALAEAVRADLAPAAPHRRTRIERQILTSMAVALDPEGRVIRFPVPAARASDDFGGAA